MHGTPAWDVRPARPEEERQAHVAELARLQERHFWFLFKKRGLEAVKLIAPTVNFEAAFAAADAAPADLRDACRGRTNGSTRTRLDEVLAQRRAHMAMVAGGSATGPCPDFGRSVHVIKVPAADPDNGFEEEELALPSAEALEHNAEPAAAEFVPNANDESSFPFLG